MDDDLTMHDDPYEDQPGAAGGKAVENPLRWVHRSLRGRYHWGVLLGLILAAPFAAVGYFALPPAYESKGIIQISPQLSTLLYKTDEANVPPMFSSYVSALGQLMKTRRVLDKALDSAPMRGIGWPRDLEGVNELESAVSVGVGRNGQLITVTATDTNPKRAQVALNSLLDAFMEIHGEQSGLGVSEKEQQLILRVQQFNRELDTKRASIARISQEFGTDDLDRIHESEVEKMQRIEDEVMALTIQIDSLSAQKGVGSAVAGEGAAGEKGTGTAAGAEANSVEQLAQLDKELADLLERRSMLGRASEQSLARFGPNHRQVREIQKQIDASDRQIEDRATQLRGQLTGGDSSAGLGGTLAKFQSRLEQAKSFLAVVGEEARDIGNKRLAINRLKEEERDIKARLQVTEKALEALTTEKPNIMAGRVAIVQRGEMAAAPSNDRRLALAGAGAAGGFALGVGIIGLAGYLKRGYRYLDELTDLSGVATLLGTLPNLNSPSEEDNALAALAIHHVRNMLHVLSPGQPGRGRFFAITSASAGEGKTSLTMALGMSFAVTGQKTLVLDADLIGRGLTGQMGLDGVMGLAEATEASDLTRCIQMTATPNLCVMPAGAIPGFDPERLSEADIERIMKKLRDRFDTILVDTGPILGSLEADIVCGRADRVVVAISRGQAPRLVQASLARLRHLGAKSVGLVFNRATPQDMTKSISHVSIHAESIRRLPSGESGRATRRMAALARAVGGKDLRYGGGSELGGAENGTAHTGGDGDGEPVKVAGAAGDGGRVVEKGGEGVKW